jgi:hypothetical protein
MDIFQSKLLSFLLPLTNTSLDKRTSLLLNPYVTNQKHFQVLPLVRLIHKLEHLYF